MVDMCWQELLPHVIVASVLVESVSMSDSRSGEKNFRVATSFGSCLRRYTLLSLKLGQSNLCCAIYATGLP
jgi:hypothetical protein